MGHGALETLFPPDVVVFEEVEQLHTTEKQGGIDEHLHLPLLVEIGPEHR